MEYHRNRYFYLMLGVSIGSEAFNKERELMVVTVSGLQTFL